MVAISFYKKLNNNEEIIFQVILKRFCIGIRIVLKLKLLHKKVVFFNVISNSLLHTLKQEFSTGVHTKILNWGSVVLFWQFTG